jgi:hypothetical protein
VLRTVILPTVDADFLLLKVESLLAQLNEQVSVLAVGWVGCLAVRVLTLTRAASLLRPSAGRRNNTQSQLHEERVAALLADRQLRAQEEERQRANLQLQVRLDVLLMLAGVRSVEAHAAARALGAAA